MTINQTICVDLLKKFPDAPTRTLANIAIKDNPECFVSYEAARTLIRRLRGASGKTAREACGVKEFQRPVQTTPQDPFDNFPEGKTHFEHWKPLEISGPARVLVMSDMHIPYHHRPSILAAIDWGKKNSVDTIVLNGDIADFFSVSFWEKDPRKRKFADELKTVKEFMDTLRSTFPKARIIFKEGNHEFRWTRFMYVKAPELLGVPEFTIPKMLNLQDADFVCDNKSIRLGKLNLLHGHEYKFAISNPVNPARGLFLRCKAYAMCGHFHQSSYHSEKTVEDTKIATWSTGCLCDMHPDYASYNNWSHGFAGVEVFADGTFQVDNKMISGGKVY